MTPKRNGTAASHEPQRRRSWTVYVTLGTLLVFLTTLLFWNVPATPFTDFTGSSTSSKKQVTHSTVGYRFVLNQTVEDARLKLQYAAGNEIPLCRRYQIVAGQWLAVNYSHPPYVPSVQHLRCYPAEHYRQSPYPSYVWMPDLAAIGHCRFDEYDAARMCALLPRATILIVGDSTSWEQYRSLVSLHGVKTRQGYQFQSLELQQNIQQALCPAVTVVFRRDDYLQEVTAAIQANFPTVLVLNRGAHYVPDAQLLKEMKGLIKEVKAWLQQCDDWKIECHFFWRTSVPGHIGCNSTAAGNAYTSPVYDVHDIEQQMIRNQSLYNDVTWEYHWQDFQHQNELILKLLRQADLSNFQVLDAYYLNVLRPDEHRAHQGDCLHNCFPGSGKVDVTNRLLLHYLRMQRSENDIARLQVVAQQRKWPVTVEDTVYDAEATNRAKEARLRKEAEALVAAAAGRSTENTSNKKPHKSGSEDKEKDRSSKGNMHASEDGSEDNEDDGSNDNEDDGSEDNDDGSEDHEEEDGKGGNDDEFGSEDIDGEEEDAENQ